MTSKVFISWSGDRSKKIAELLGDWLQCVIQAVDPWISSKDIDRGALWFNEISEQLASTSIGIVCLTKENINKPWILFESGALAKGLSANRVCTFLIDLESTDVENPLAQFNHTFPNKDSMWNLVRTINLSLKDNILRENTLSSIYETYWPQFESRFKTIISTTHDSDLPIKRDNKDIMLDILSTVRMLDRRLNSLENNTDSFNNVLIQKDIRNEHIASNLLRQKILSCINQQIPPESIIEGIYKETSIPKFIIKNALYKLLNERNNNNIIINQTTQHPEL